MSWSTIGNVFAKIGKGALAVAVWAEAHPEVLQEAVAAAQVISTAKI